jgi:CBS domain-containing protein
VSGTFDPPGPAHRPFPAPPEPPYLGRNPDEEAPVQARDVMTRDVVTVGPMTSAKYAAEVMERHGYAALPVVDDDALIGIVAEADVLRHRIPTDPRLHARREEDSGPVAPQLVGEVMTADVRTVDVRTDLADIAGIFVDDRLRSVPVLEDGRLAGIVSRRDVLHALVRPDDELRDELQGLVESYTGEPGAYDVRVTDGVATVRRVTGRAQPSAAVEEQAITEIARTVGGIVACRVSSEAPQHEVGTGGSR